MGFVQPDWANGSYDTAKVMSCGVRARCQGKMAMPPSGVAS